MKIANAKEFGRVAVVMGGPTTALRDQNAEDLLLTGFNVMQRRANGEKIVVAQNMFEPTELDGPVVRPPSEQGDGDPAAEARHRPRSR